ncbi:MAG: hypothetical protein JWQ54_2292 [Mucilaginibacter sp.]|nr:hypothetical protein [Mucilaginibacter sp.]
MPAHVKSSNNENHIAAFNNFINKQIRKHVNSNFPEPIF